jgi:nicotinamidase-related amidase
MRKIRTDALDPSPTVLLLVDFINPLRFPGATDLAHSAVEAARCAAGLRRRLKAKGCRTIYANDNYGRWTADFQQLWHHCAALKGNAGELARRMAPQARDFTLLKPRHSAFYATPLDILLQQLQCRQLVIAGIAADSCVLFSAMDAYLRGYALWVPADCVAAESSDARDQALAQMARVLKADTTPSNEASSRT